VRQLSFQRQALLVRRGGRGTKTGTHLSPAAGNLILTRARLIVF
jgi:hypothetical protein